MSAHDFYSGRPVALATKADADPSVVSDYVSRLQDALDALRQDGDEDSFPVIVAEVEGLSKAEKIAIAEELTKFSVSSGADAMRRIDQLWQAVLGTVRGIRATGGRSAS